MDEVKHGKTHPSIECGEHLVDVDAGTATQVVLSAPFDGCEKTADFHAAAINMPTRLVAALDLRLLQFHAKPR